MVLVPAFNAAVLRPGRRLYETPGMSLIILEVPSFDGSLNAGVEPLPSRGPKASLHWYLAEPMPSTQELAR
jgi:hypothetical protein